MRRHSEWLGLASGVGLVVASAPAAADPTTAPASTVLNTNSAAKLSLDPTISADSQEFSEKLKDAMRQGADPISVDLAKSTTTVPKALGDWLVKIQDSGGEVRLKTTNLGAGKVLGKAISAAVCKTVPGAACDIAGIVIKELQRTSRNYNAVILIAKQKEVECVAAVNFYRRKGEAWKTAAGAGEAAPPLAKKGFGTLPAAITTCPFATK